MARLRLNPSLVAAGALLVSGCEYWDNMTRTWAVDKTELVLKVVDAWKGDPLPEATCTIDGETREANDQGLVIYPEIETGSNSVTCSLPGYFPGAGSVEVRAGKRNEKIFGLACRGAYEWYPDRPERQVSLMQVQGNLNFPGRMRLQAFPVDTSGIFKYEWTTTFGILESNGPDSRWLRTLPQENDRAEALVEVRVIATLAGITYDVGSAALRLDMFRNVKPEITLFRDDRIDSIKLGCEEGGNDFFFGLTSSDPDGECLSVRIVSTDSKSSLGRIDTTVECGQAQEWSFPLKPLKALRSTVPFTVDNVLRIRVTDDNDQYSEKEIRFMTYSNLVPAVNLTQEKVGDQNFVDSLLVFRVVARDQDEGSLRRLILDWNGDPLPINLGNESAAIDRTFQRSFDSAGTYTVKATVVDACRDSTTAVLQVPVVANPSPGGP